MHGKMKYVTMSKIRRVTGYRMQIRQLSNISMKMDKITGTMEYGKQYDR